MKRRDDPWPSRRFCSAVAWFAAQPSIVAAHV